MLHFHKLMEGGAYFSFDGCSPWFEKAILLCLVPTWSHLDSNWSVFKQWRDRMPYKQLTSAELYLPWWEQEQYHGATFTFMMDLN